MQDIRGNLKSYHKRDIAIEYLNLALSEYKEGKNMFAVVHLAGAVEEIFGQLASLKKKENALNRTHRWTRSWYKIAKKNTPPIKDLNKYILNIKNGIKHINSDDDLQIGADINREEKEVIRRAIENLNKIST